MNSFEKTSTTPPPPDPEERRRQQRLELLRMKSGAPRGPRAMPGEQSTRERNVAEQAAGFRQRYLERNPNDAAGAEMAAGMAKMFDTQKRLHSGEMKVSQERLRAVKELAEFNARWTAYVHERGEDRAALERHWRTMESIAESVNEGSSYRITRSGVITQVATVRIFEALHVPHKSATVEEDAIYKIDLWVQSEPIQIKTGPQAERVEIVETDTASPLHVAVTGAGQREAYVSSSSADEALGFRFELNRYAEQLHRPSLRGFFIVIPKRQIDYHTGKPSDQLVADVAAELERLHYPIRTQGEAEMAEAA